MEDLIEKTIDFVKVYFENDYSGHDFYHTMRVYNLAKHIASKEECDMEIVCLGALLHDVDDYKIVGIQEDKNKNTKTFLKSQNYPEDKIEKICQIISQLAFKGKDSEKPDTIEGMIVQDSDRLDALGAMGISRTFVYSGCHNRPIHIPEIKYRNNISKEEYFKKGSETAINHFYEKLLKLKDLMNTNTAKSIAEHRHEFMKIFLNEFFDEWEGIC